MRYIIGIGSIIIGILMVWKTFDLSRIVGTIPWAEQKLGGGGTYVLLKIVGVLLVIFGLFYIFGILEILLYPFRNLFSGFSLR